MFKLILLATALTATACATDDVDPTDPTIDSDDGAPIDSARRPPLEAVKTDGDHGLCDALPDTGPCSLACTPEKLIAHYVQPGTCAIFECTPTDGREPFSTGGCND